MPERLRSIVNHIRRFVGERRHASRHPARLRITVSLAEEHGRSSHAQSLTGHTRDLSATGIALILPSIRIGERYLVGEGRTILVALELPEATISFRATPVCYERLDTDGREAGYFVGAHITKMSDRDRALFIEHLKKLGRG